MATTPAEKNIYRQARDNMRLTREETVDMFAENNFSMS